MPQLDPKKIDQFVHRIIENITTPTEEELAQLAEMMSKRANKAIQEKGCPHGVFGLFCSLRNIFDVSIGNIIAWMIVIGVWYPTLAILCGRRQQQQQQPHQPPATEDELTEWTVVSED